MSPARPVLAVALCAVALGAAAPAVGSEVVASAPAPDPASSDLAGDATGRQVAAVALPVGDGYAVHARSRPRAGGPWGAPVRLSGVTARRPADLRATLDDRGRAVVAWRRPVGAAGWDLRYAIRPAAAGDWERERSLVSALPGDGAVASPSLAAAGDRATFAWGEVGPGGWQVRRAVLDLASATPRTWTAGPPVVLGGRPSVAVAPGGDAVAVSPATDPGQPLAQASGPVRATTHAPGGAGWEAVAILDASGREASAAIADGGTAVAAWRRGLPATGVLAAVRPGPGAPWGAAEALSTFGFQPAAAAGPTGAALVAYGVDLDEEAGGPDPTSSEPRGQVLRARRRASAGAWDAEETVFAVPDARSGTYQRAQDVSASLDGLGTALLAWSSSYGGLMAPWGTAVPPSLPFGPPARYAIGDAVGQVALAPTGRGDAGVLWADTATRTTVRTDRLPVAACATPPPAPAPSSPGTVTLTLTQLIINQRIYSAAIRRADALDAWLAAGVEARDLCGGGIRATELGAGVGVAAATAPRAAVVPSPRPLRIRPAAVVPDSTFTLTTVQLRINQRIASRAVRQANALLARLDGGLSGGDVRDGAVGAAHLAPTIAVSGLAPAPPPPPTRTVVAPATPDPDAVFTLTAAQLRINQRIGQAAIRRLNAVRARLLDGVAGDELRAATLTAADIAPSPLRSQNSR